VLGGRALLDLDYLEDKDAEVDLALVMTSELEFIELQASGRRASSAIRTLPRCWSTGARIRELCVRQEEILASL